VYWQSHHQHAQPWSLSMTAYTIGCLHDLCRQLSRPSSSPPDHVVAVMRHVLVRCWSGVGPMRARPACSTLERLRYSSSQLWARGPCSTYDGPCGTYDGSCRMPLQYNQPIGVAVHDSVAELSRVESSRTDESEYAEALSFTGECRRSSVGNWAADSRLIHKPNGSRCSPFGGSYCPRGGGLCKQSQGYLNTPVDVLLGAALK
jgi:hypothetical protein